MSRREGMGSRRTDGQSGATLLEVLIGVLLASAVALAVGGGLVFVTRTWYGNQARLEAQQNLRIAVERVVRELRLAGACLPRAGEIPALLPVQGTDAGERDVLVFRTNQSCAASALRATYGGGGGPIQLERVEGFAVGMQAYIWNPRTRSGEFFRVAAVDVVGQSVTPGADTPVAGRYPASESSVMGVEVQRYEVGERRGVPELRLHLNPDLPGGVPEPLARGIERFNLRYVLQRPYAAVECVAGYTLGGGETLCVKDQPSELEWPLVRLVQLEVWARSTRPVPGGGGDGFYRIQQGDFSRTPVVVRPRNLLHGDPRWEERP